VGLKDGKGTNVSMIGMPIENIIALPIIDEIGKVKQCRKFTSLGECIVESTYHYTMEIIVDNNEPREKATG
jgi:hypothetical protein